MPIYIPSPTTADLTTFLEENAERCEALYVERMAEKVARGESVVVDEDLSKKIAAEAKRATEAWKRETNRREAQ